MFNGPFCPEVLYFGRAANGKPIIGVENATHSSIAGLLFLQRRGCTWSLFLQGAFRRRMCEFVGKMSRRHLSAVWGQVLVSTLAPMCHLVIVMCSSSTTARTSRATEPPHVFGQTMQWSIKRYSAKVRLDYNMRYTYEPDLHRPSSWVATMFIFIYLFTSTKSTTECYQYDWILLSAHYT